MKLTQNNNTSNIITDKDITLTGDFSSLGNTLFDVIDEQQKQIEKLRSNVKWIYQYGGTGGHGGGGGGGASTSKIVLTKLDTGAVINSNSQLIYGDESSTKKLGIQLYGGGTSMFKVEYSYTNSGGSVTGTVALTAMDNYKELLMYFNQNTDFSLKVTNQDTGEPVAIYSNKVITSSYKFNLVLAYADSYKTDKRIEVFTPTANRIYLNMVKQRGLVAILESNIAVDFSQGSGFTYTDWQGISHEVISTPDNPVFVKGSNIVAIPLVSNVLGEDDSIRFLSDNNNAGYYTFTLDVKLLLPGSTVQESIPQFKLGNTLIPSDLFLQVTSNSYITLNQYEEIEEDKASYQGTIVFNLTAFKGSQDDERTYNLRIFVDGVPYYSDITMLKDQNPTNIPVTLLDVGKHKVTFQTEVQGEEGQYSAHYYIGIKQVASSYNWLRGVNGYELFFNQGAGNTSQCFKQLGTTYFEMDTRKSDLKVDLDWNPTNTEQYGFLFFLGIQFKENGELDKPICTLKSVSSPSYDIVVYQNRMDILSAQGQVAKTIEIFVPIEVEYNALDHTKYNLINLFEKVEYTKTLNVYRSLRTYVNGVLDGVNGSFNTSCPKYQTLIFHPNNYAIDYVNLMLINDVDTSGRSINDLWVVDHYYNYCAMVQQNTTIPEYNKVLISTLKEGMTIRESIESNSTLQDSIIELSDNAVTALEANLDIPIIQLHYASTDDDTLKQQGKTYGEDLLLNWLHASYGEDAAIPKIPVSVSYKKLNSNKFIDIDTESNPFKIAPQGSSTLGYRCKNFELYAPEVKAQDADYIYVYTPNFDINDSSTFLPEKSFTLKADVVDSAHCNNNVMGNFINSVTTKFNSAKQYDSEFKDWTKNCLTGFPVLVILSNTFREIADADAAKHTKYYFLGIYNFNLGRKSYFNLGYYDYKFLNNIGNSLRNNNGDFAVYQLGTSYGEDSLQLKNGIQVAEIQGNSSYYDFSQFDDTILFGNAGKQAMFGDAVTQNENIWKNNIKSITRDISISGGTIFKYFNKPFSTTEVDSYGYNKGYSDYNSFPNFQYQAVRKVSGTVSQYEYTLDNSLKEISDNTSYLLQCVEGFEDESGNIIAPVIDYTSLSEYYTTCMAFGLVDSVQKNLNIKTWDNHLFYTAFYDMDTSFGISNSGGYIDYFAFSDYWETSTNGDVINQVEVKRDYAPKVSYDDSQDESSNVEGEGFFDTPTSYLFAIAKYYSIFTSDENYQMKAPYNLWAAWRSLGGHLESAKSFMQNYYNEYTKDIPDLLYNLDYTYKYLIREGTEFNKYNQEKMHGRRRYYVEQWLNNRFHLLDAYFNLPKIWDYYTVAGSSQYYPIPSESFQYANNKDIQILRSIFQADGSSQAGVQLANIDVSPEISAIKHSAFIIQLPGNGGQRYLFPDTDSYKFQISTSGNQDLKLLGSKSWYSISNFTPFLPVSGTFSLYSDKLLDITAEGNTSKTCTGYIFETPNIKSIKLTGKKFGGTLKVGSDKESLDEIDISSTGITLNADQCHFTKLTATDKNGGDIQVTNNKYLSELNVSGSSGNLNNIGSLKVPIYSNSINLSYINMQVLQLYDNEIYQECDIVIENCPKLTDITIAHCRSLTIKQCNNLKHVIVTKQCESIDITSASSLSLIQFPANTLKSFHLSDCGLNAQTLTAKHTGSTVSDGTIDLSNTYVGYSTDELKTFAGSTAYNKALPTTSKFALYKANSISEGVRNFQTLILSNNVDTVLFTNALANCQELKTIISNKYVYIAGTGVFLNTYNLDISTSNIKYRILYNENVKSLASMFQCGSGSNTITVNDAFTRFINVITSTESGGYSAGTQYITDISYMFYNRNVVFDSSSNSTFTLGVFSNVNNVSGAFLNSKGSNAYISSNLFRGLGANVAELKVDSFLNSNLLYIKNDTLHSIINKINKLPFTSAGGLVPVIIVDNVNDYAVRDLFFANEDSAYPAQLTQLHFTLQPKNSSQQISLKDLFNAEEDSKNWPNLVTLNHCLRFNSNVFNTNIVDYEELLANIPTKLVDIQYSFNFNADKDYPSDDADSNPAIDLERFLNLEKLLFVDPTAGTKTYKPSLNGKVLFLTWYGSHPSLHFNKYLKYSTFQKWMELLFDIKNKLNGIECLFSNCTIIEYTNNPVIGFKNNIALNNRITSINRLFYNFKAKYNLESTSYNPIYIDNDNTTGFFAKVQGAPFTQGQSTAPGMSLVQTFQNVYFAESIPFDFFKKRQEHIKENIYYEQLDGLDEEDNPIIKRVKGKYIYYDYYTNIADLQSCFRDTTFIVDVRSGNEQNYCKVKSQNIPINRIVDLDNNIVDASFYYDSSTGRDKKYVEVTTEYQDLKEIEDQLLDPQIESKIKQGLYIQSITITIGNGTPRGINNFSIQGNKDYYSLFITPDIFYGCTPNCCIQSCFAQKINPANQYVSNSFRGLIPQHLLKNVPAAAARDSGSELYDIFKNLCIFPKYVCTIEESDNIYNIFQYIPNEFTTFRVLDSAFNFLFFIPRQSQTKNVLIEEGKYKEKIEHTCHILMSDKSIPSNVQKLSHAFPSIGLQTDYGSNISSYSIHQEWGPLQINYGVFFNLMYDYEAAINSGTFVTGINKTSKFRDLVLDNLISNIMTNYYADYIFDSDFDVAISGLYQDRSSYCINLTSGNTVVNDLSINMRLPKLSFTSGTGQRFLNTAGGVTTRNISRIQLVNTANASNYQLLLKGNVLN